MSARLAPAHMEQLCDMGLGMLPFGQVAAVALRAEVAAHSVLLAADDSLPVLRGLLRYGVALQSNTALDITTQVSSVSSLDEAEKWEVMTQLLIHELSPVVSLTGLTLDTMLAELSVDSLTAVAIVQRIRQRTGKTLPISAFLTDPGCVTLW